MKRFSEQLKKQSTSLKLRGDERADLRDRLVTYMEYHPLPAEMRADQKATAAAALTTDPFVTFKVNWHMVRGFVGSFAVITLIVLPLVAERAAPGDVLYPIKVELNEELRSTLALTPEKKIEWETTRLERRIAEARVLASEGKLSEAVEAEVAAAVKEQSQKTKNEIAKLRTTDEAEAAFAEIAFVSMIEVQNELLEQTIAGAENEVPTKEGEVARGTGVAQVLATEIGTALSDAPGKLTTDQLLAKIEEETTRAQELYQSVEAYATSEEDTSIGRRLDDVERAVRTAQALLEPTTITVAEPVSTTSPETVDEVVTELVNETTEDENIDPLIDAESEITDEETATSVAEAIEGSEEVVVEAAPAEAQPIVTEVSEEAREEAKALLQGALKDLRKLISFMSDIDIRESVDVETIVPVVPTDEELQATVVQKLNGVEAAYAEFSATTEGQEFGEKVTIGIASLEDSISITKTSLDEGRYKAAQELVREAEAFLTDIRKMVIYSEGPAVSEATDDETAETEESVDGATNDESVDDTETDEAQEDDGGE